MTAFFLTRLPCAKSPRPLPAALAASAVRQFRPRIVTPYHYRQGATFDIAAFKTIVGTDLGVEVRLRNFY